MKNAEHDTSRKTRIYPIFLPHAGCPFQCVYCNQRAVTSLGCDISKGIGLISSFKDRLASLVEEALRTSLVGEVAFYGGTFTALPSDLLRQILDTVSPWVQKGLFSGIRFSTRPDNVTPEVTSILRCYPVQTVELGVQSFVEEVLLEARRGYNVNTVKKAATLVHENNWRLGLQMMPGLPGDSLNRFLESVGQAIALQPHFVRVYPTLVLAKTVLAEWYYRAIYRPLSLDEAILWCVQAYDALLEAGIPVARMGLHADPEIRRKGEILAGPFHPAFGYLVRVHWWRDRLDKRLQNSTEAVFKKHLNLRVSDRSVSEVIGPERANILHWQKRWRLERVKVEGLPDYDPRFLELCVD